MLEGVRASGMTSDLVGINPNFGDTATITSACGSGNQDICAPYNGIEAGNGDGGKIPNSNQGCLGLGAVNNFVPAC